MAKPQEGQRRGKDPWSIGFGAVMLAAALLILLAWLPNDISGGFLEADHAGKTSPGDAFFPIILGCLLLVLSIAQLLEAFFAQRPQMACGRLSPDNLKFLFLVYTIAVVGLACMYWLGPWVVDSLRALGVLDKSYRQLLDTVPYKYLGFVAGGGFLSISLIAWADGDVRLPALVTTLAVLASLVLIFDVLLHNVQLPPNADF